jgi:hypothetical protein
MGSNFTRRLAIRRKPSVLLLSILVHAAALFLLGTADLWAPIAHWPVPHEVLAFSENPRLVRLDDIELPRAPRSRVAGATVAPNINAVPELAPVVAASGVAPETAREGSSSQPGVPGGAETRSVALLDQAAVDAVRQWKFSPTLLNGVAVPIVMTVTVNFVFAQ